MPHYRLMLDRVQLEHLAAWYKIYESEGYAKYCDEDLVKIILKLLGWKLEDL